MFDPDKWLRQQQRRQAWIGPAAVSAYISLAIQLACTGLSAIAMRQLERANLYIFVINILIGVFIIAVDQVCSHLNHSLRYFRISAERSRRRVRALGIKSDHVDRFVRALWMDPQIELTFRNRRVRSVELTVEALDVLSQTAARYGRRGRKVFLTNQEPIVEAMELIQSMPLATAEEILTEPLRDWLEDPVKFDPEGWALRVLGHL
jgi:hypothetical protein